MEKKQLKSKVLLVDDDYDLVLVVKTRLELLEFEVVSAYNGDEALKILEHYNPDVVLLDINMPVVDGLETLKEIKKKRADLPVFIFSVLSSGEKFEKIKKIGVAGYIIKSGNLKAEMEKVLQYLLNVKK